MTGLRGHLNRHIHEIAEAYDVIVRESPQLRIPAIPIQNLPCESPSEFMENILEEYILAFKRMTPVNHYENMKYNAPMFVFVLSINIITNASCLIHINV